jgi:hypothetical protein
MYLLQVGLQKVVVIQIHVVQIQETPVSLLSFLLATQTRILARPEMPCAIKKPGKAESGCEMSLY